MRNIVLTKQALEDLRYWSETEIRLLKKSLDLIESVARNPFQGIAKQRL